MKLFIVGRRDEPLEAAAPGRRKRHSLFDEALDSLANKKQTPSWEGGVVYVRVGSGVGESLAGICSRQIFGPLSVSGSLTTRTE